MSVAPSSSYYPVLTIVGKDLDVRATFNSDLAGGTGYLPAGTFLKYDPAAKVFTPTTTAADIFGILAGEANTGADPVPVMCYRAGTFLRQEIEVNNKIAVPPGGALDIALRDIGIYLEWSYMDYDGLTPVPSGVTNPVVA